MREEKKAFTLTELLVLLGVLALLAACLLPARAAGRAGGQSLLCLANVKQLSCAWLLYASDATESIPLNQALQNTLSWVGGNVAATPGATNISLVTSATLYPYVQSTNAYRCPADTSVVMVASLPLPKVRTYSMNSFLNGSTSVPNYPISRRLRDIRNPKPAETFVFVEEHPTTLGDCSFFIDPRPEIAQWASLPAFFHGPLSVFSYADGHAAAVRWVERITPQLRGSGAQSPLGAASPDLAKLKSMTAK